MQIPEFRLERFFAKFEFACRYNLAASDVQGWRMDELLALADDDMRAAWADLTLGYTESSGHPLLRAEIARAYAGSPHRGQSPGSESGVRVGGQSPGSESGVRVGGQSRGSESGVGVGGQSPGSESGVRPPTLTPISGEEVFVVAGAEEGIFLAMHAILSPGDHAIVVVPAYQSLHEIARSIGAEVTEFALDPDGWTLDVDRLLASITDRTRVVVINFPHNPTGTTISRADLERLAAACEERSVHLFADEVYRGLERDAPALPPAATLGARTISLGVMSKTFALAGLRIGWIATRDRDLLGRISRLKDYTTICSAGPSEVLAIIALRSHDQVVARSRDIVDGNLAGLTAFMAAHADHIAWTPPRAGSTCFPRLLTGSADALADDLVRTTGVLIIPGSRFGPYETHFRIGFGRHDTLTGLSILGDYLRSGAVAAD